MGAEVSPRTPARGRPACHPLHHRGIQLNEVSETIDFTSHQHTDRCPQTRPDIHGVHHVIRLNFVLITDFILYATGETVEDQRDNLTHRTLFTSSLLSFSPIPYQKKFTHTDEAATFNRFLRLRRFLVHEQHHA